MSRDERILRPGETCWRIEPADRLACIVDAADYFRHAKAAMLGARRRIMLIGWDFDVRIRLEPVEKTLEGPNRLGRFLSWLVKRSPELEIYLLKWDAGVLTSMGRGMMPVALLDYMTSDRLHLQLDAAHPMGAAHHQKIVVIDDALVFCGGIDMTVDRWDTSGHRDDDRRTTPNGNRYGPWHDATTAVDGAAARAVGEVARRRWRAATGEELPPIDSSSPAPWPDDLEPSMRDVDVAIARTLPEQVDQPEVREIEALYLAAIAQARQLLYLESQFLASRTLAEALADRLQDPDGPEVVLVLPLSAESWLQQQTMDGARRRLLHLLWAADRYGRLGVYYPVTAQGEPIYVHAKVLVLDDRLLRVGSSNLNNRSMGFDSECDLAVEVTTGTPNGAQLREAIVSIRRRLVSEHLDVAPGDLQDAVDRGSSLLAAIEALRGEGKSLRLFEPETVADDDSPLADTALMDPEGTTPRIWDRLRRRLTGT